MAVVWCSMRNYRHAILVLFFVTVSIGIGYLLWPIAPLCKQGGVKLLDDFVSCSNEVEFVRKN
jgi:hypothetical protein